MTKAHATAPNRERTVRRAFAAASLLYALSVVVPWRPQYTGDVDDSWIYLLHTAWTHGWQFGRVAFTYGPWGFLSQGFTPQTIGLLLIVWTLAAVVMWWNVWDLSASLSRKPWLRAVAVVVLFGVIAATDLRAIACPILLLIVHGAQRCDRYALARKLSLVLLVALLSLCKFTFFMLAVPIVLLIAVDEAMRRKVPWTLVTWVAGIAIFWLAAGQSPLGFFSYLKWSLEISGHHSEAMSLYGQPGDNSLPGYLLLAAALVILYVLSVRPLGLRKVLIGAAGFVATFFIVFKIGYLRRDTHVIVAAGFPLFVGLLLVIACWSAMHKATRIAAIVLVAASVWLSGSVRSIYWATSLPRGLFATFSAIPSNLAALVVHLTGGPTSEQAIFQAQTNPLPAPADVGKVDFYPTATLSELASGVELSKRPAWESYNAFTPALLQLDAAHLTGSSAPDTIFFDVDPLDHRFPALDDSLSWPELLTHYQPAGAWNQRLVLRRRPVPARYRLQPLSSRSATLGESIDLADVDAPLVWVAIDLEPNLRHAVMQTLYRPHEVWMQAQLQDGSTPSYRMIPGIGRAGFLLSPVIETRSEFASLYEPDFAERLAARKLTKLVLKEVTYGGAQQFDPHIQLHFSRLVVERE